MTLSRRLFVIMVGAVSLCACSHHRDTVAAEEPKPAVVRSSHRAEHITGEVVRRNGQYRLKVLSEDGQEAEAAPAAGAERILRLSRSRNPKDFASDEIQLRKYYGKTIVVKGYLEQDWVAKADVVGQWLQPGEKRGSTLVGPEPN